MTNLGAQEVYTNALIKEDSPYLQQHAHNPVDWHAWGDAAFEQARAENKLIFLSIGYSTCHWCHVMEKESFENEEVAKILNKYYISIKVDREEMPHVDKYYQDVHSVLNRRGGGWPLSIVLTPQRKAFFAATYIPNEPRYAQEGIKSILLKIQGVFETNPEKITASAQQIEDVLKRYTDGTNQEQTTLEAQYIQKFITDIGASFDTKYYGIGSAPKFPHASSIETLLDIYSVYSDKKALDMAKKTLQAMANGGIYDQIEGGFYRYSVDEQWMIPHFEKMLYTNAELLSAYAKAYRITKDAFYKKIADEIVLFTRERFEHDSLLYSASDADSLVASGEKREGAYFVFEYEQTKEHLQKDGFDTKEIKEILAYFNITKHGNFEDEDNNPYLDGKNAPEKIQQAKKSLKNLRAQKAYPFVDYKILTSWNALYIRALFESSKMQSSHGDLAVKYIDTLLKKLYIDGTLYHQKVNEKAPTTPALFEDYSFLIAALLGAYEYTLDYRYLHQASVLSQNAIKKFYKNKNWHMSDDAFDTITPVFDSSYKSPLSVMIENLLALAVLKEDLSLQEIAKETLQAQSFSLANAPVNAAGLVSSFLAYERGYIVLKAPSEKLKAIVLPQLPFLLRKISTENQYLACKVDTCFAYGNDFDEVREKIVQESQSGLEKY